MANKNQKKDFLSLGIVILHKGNTLLPISSKFIHAVKLCNKLLP